MGCRVHPGTVSTPPDWTLLSSITNPTLLLISKTVTAINAPRGFKTYEFTKATDLPTTQSNTETRGLTSYSWRSHLCSCESLLAQLYSDTRRISRNLSSHHHSRHTLETSWVVLLGFKSALHSFIPFPSNLLQTLWAHSGQSHTHGCNSKGELRFLPLAGLSVHYTKRHSVGKQRASHQLTTVTWHLSTSFSMCHKACLRVKFTRGQSTRIHV